MIASPVTLVPLSSVIPIVAGLTPESASVTFHVIVGLLFVENEPAVGLTIAITGAGFSLTVNLRDDPKVESVASFDGRGSQPHPLLLLLLDGNVRSGYNWILTEPLTVASYFPVELLSVSVYVCPLMTVCTVFTAIFLFSLQYRLCVCFTILFFSSSYMGLLSSSWALLLIYTLRYMLSTHFSHCIGRNVNYKMLFHIALC